MEILEKSLELLQQLQEQGKDAEYQRLESALKDLLELQIFALAIIHHWVYYNQHRKDKVNRPPNPDPKKAPLDSFQKICSEAKLVECLEKAALIKKFPLLENLIQIWKDPNSSVDLGNVETILKEMKGNPNYSHLFSCDNCDFSFKTTLMKSLESIKRNSSTTNPPPTQWTWYREFLPEV